MKDQQAFRRIGADVAALVREHLRQPQRLARALGLIDVDLAAPGVHRDDPHQAGPHDEPDDEQPPVELGVHRREV